MEYLTISVDSSQKFSGECNRLQADGWHIHLETFRVTMTCEDGMMDYGFYAIASRIRPKKDFNE